MPVRIATDHGGFRLKEELLQWLRAAGTRSSTSERVGSMRATTTAIRCSRRGRGRGRPHERDLQGRADGRPGGGLGPGGDVPGAEYSAAERHLRRLGKLAVLETGGAA